MTNTYRFALDFFGRGEKERESEGVNIWLVLAHCQQGANSAIRGKGMGRSKTVVKNLAFCRASAGF